MDPSYLTQEDAPTNPSNGDADPNVQRKLFTFGTGSCGGSNSCLDVTSTSEIGVNSCIADYSCYELDGTYN